MNILAALWVFYKKLIFPSFAISVLLALFFIDSSKFLSGVGIAYVFLTPSLHFLFYDLSRPKEYYFYHNLGLSKTTLYLNSILISLIIGIILLLI
ncbi:hypothetical protein SAMN04489864_104145 [Pedobacter insulae]|uniref:Uncharacterized protein n=1 Tax=Pedobacter insulae TaxID=414048 RepID=A0A1I2WLL5_9SPHI|nr:hypothetical protein SAMN04489864_104145 [Pedobacter insulae]